MRSPLSLLFAKPKPSSPQSLVTGPVFMVLDLSGGPLQSLSSFSRSLLNWVPTAGHSLFQVWSHQCWPEGESDFLGNVVQAFQMWPGVKFAVCTGRVRCWLLFSLVSTIIPSPSESFSVASQSVLMHGVVSSQVQNFVLLLVECHEVSVGSIFLFYKVPLDSSSANQHVNYSLECSVLCKSAESAVCPSCRFLMKMLHSVSSTHNPWGTVVV